MATRRIYTGIGDDGSTRLGDGTRVSKSAARLEAYGTVDELSASLGVVLATGPASPLVEPLSQCQADLFRAGAELSTPPGPRRPAGLPIIEKRHVAALERTIDRFEADLPALTAFILPGGTPAAAALHLARTVCRRAERAVVRLLASEPFETHVVVYLNRLSDALFVFARYDNHLAGVTETAWEADGPPEPRPT